MGKIELDHTGSGGGVTLSSDGTDLLLDGAAVGGGADLFAENYDGTSGLPSATGTNGVAIGKNAKAIGADSAALGLVATATNTASVALGLSRSAGTHSVSMNTVTSSASYGALGNNSIAGQYIAKASGTRAIALGNETLATNTNSIALGDGATASGSNAYSFGGTASGTSAYSFGGTASGTSSVNLRGNTASGDYSLAVGRKSVASIYGQKAFANGNFAANGDAQGSMFILRAATTDATATVLTTDNSTAGSTNQIVAASDTCITFDGTITAMQNGAQAYASWKIEGLLVNDGGTTTLANSATTVIQNLSNWGMAVSADNTNNALAITVTGEAAHNIRWVANIRTTEVTYA